MGAATTCRCGHSQESHAHYTHATNCVLCACPWWKPRWIAWAWTLTGLAAALAAVWWILR